MRLISTYYSNFVVCGGCVALKFLITTISLKMVYPLLFTTVKYLSIHIMYTFNEEVLIMSHCYSDIEYPY